MIPIQQALLGILSFKPFTGYDMKKIMQDSPFMYWSGNNNQIYKALVELHGDGLVTNEVRHQDGAPSKKIYSITEAGLAKLKEWSMIAPEAPEYKKAFLVQLAWAWQLDNAELTELLHQYQREVEGQLFIAQSKIDAGRFMPSRTPRERVVWQLIHQNVLNTYRHELDWVRQACQALEQFGGDDDDVVSQT